MLSKARTITNPTIPTRITRSLPRVPIKASPAFFNQPVKQTFLNQVKDKLSRLYINWRYKTYDCLEETAMSRVYLAFDRVRRRNTVLKIAMGDISNKFVENEVELMRQNISPIFPELYAYGRYGHERYIAMEYIEGKTLKDHLRNDERVPLYKSIEITMNILYGLNALHEKGWIHRDIKPGNIMVSGDFHRLLDLGLATRMGKQPGKKPMGTPLYMSPEQVDHKPLDQRSDIYSAGWILYEMVAEHNPMIGDNPMETALNHLNKPALSIPKHVVEQRIKEEKRESLKEQIDELHAIIIAVTNKMIAKNPFERFTNAGQIYPLLQKARIIAKDLAAYEIN